MSDQPVPPPFDPGRAPAGPPSWAAPPPMRPGLPPIPPGPGPSTGGYPAAAERTNQARGRTGLAALAVIIALLIGFGGVFVGATVERHQSDSSGSTLGVATTPVTTALPPLKGDEAEPAQAVARVLGPAVVQIETGSGLGSGFVYDKSGLVMTASHVTDGTDRVQVRLSDGTKVQGKVLGEDKFTDVAVVKIDPPKGLAVATLATGVPTQVGQTAIAIGSPFGLDQTVTSGIVSAVGRSVKTPAPHGVIPAIQTDAPINSGNSGGALADRRGRIIGINDSIVTGRSGTTNTGNVGVGFAIPIDIAKTVADKLVAGESTAGGFLGIRGANATGTRSGAAVTSVEKGSPADDAGLTTDDVVTAIDGKRVSSMVDLAAGIRTRQPSDKVTLTIRRGDKERTVVVTLGAATGN
ncbi:MAG: S1C family serine protease [Acidimicrobiales bacterium]